MSEMRFGDTSRLGRPFAKDPAVVRFGGRYLLYYSMPPYDAAIPPERRAPGAGTGWGIGIAESRDLDAWRKVGEVLPEQPCEANGICAPGARVLGDRVHIFYQTYGNGPKDALCHAVSRDGLRFERDDTNPVFSPSVGLGVWHNGRAIDADVIPWKGRLLLFYSTRDPAGEVQMGGVAAAPLASDYRREAWTQLSVEGPILRPTLPWERRCIEAAATCEHGGRLYMFYAGGYNNEPQQIGCAVCDEADGDSPLRWRRVSDAPLLPNGGPGAWNASESGHPFLFTDEDDAHHLFFQGNDDGGRTWHLSRRRVEWRGDTPRVVAP